MLIPLSAQRKWKLLILDFLFDQSETLFSIRYTQIMSHHVKQPITITWLNDVSLTDQIKEAGSSQAVSYQTFSMFMSQEYDLGIFMFI